MKKPPCIRNLTRFKKGCPKKGWDGNEGCSAWIEMTAPDPDNPMKKIIDKGCLDTMSFKIQYTQLQLLEGNQKAIESFRNGMVQEDENGKTAPKINPNIAALYMTQKDQVDEIKKQFVNFLEFFQNAAKNKVSELESKSNSIKEIENNS